jgi:hypothetical protein
LYLWADIKLHRICVIRLEKIPQFDDEIARI